VQKNYRYSEYNLKESHVAMTLEITGGIHELKHLSNLFLALSKADNLAEKIFIKPKSPDGAPFHIPAYIGEIVQPNSKFNFLVKKETLFIFGLITHGHWGAMGEDIYENFTVKGLEYIGELAQKTFDDLIIEHNNNKIPLPSQSYPKLPKKLFQDLEFLRKRRNPEEPCTMTIEEFPENPAGYYSSPEDEKNEKDE
jgi:hypothetical protein